MARLGSPCRSLPLVLAPPNPCTFSPSHAPPPMRPSPCMHACMQHGAPIMQLSIDDGSGPSLYCTGWPPFLACAASSLLTSPRMRPGSTVIVLPSPCACRVCMVCCGRWGGGWVGVEESSETRGKRSAPRYPRATRRRSLKNSARSRRTEGDLDLYVFLTWIS